jgi:GDP-D-mannose dehydratase
VMWRILQQDVAEDYIIATENESEIAKVAA